LIWLIFVTPSTREAISGPKICSTCWRLVSVSSTVSWSSPVAIDVTADAPLRLPLDALVGWVGGLTPKVSLTTEDDPGSAVVELTGDGRVLADPGAGWGDVP